MKDPCKNKCIERDFCQGEFPCRKRLAYLRWKEKAALIWKKDKMDNPEEAYEKDM